MTSHKRTRALWTGAVVTLLIVEVVLLAARRGSFVVGWELLGFADASWGLHHDGLFPTVARYFRQTRQYQYWDSTNSFVFPLLAAALEMVVPWTQWAGVVVFVVCWASAFVCVRSLQLPIPAFLAAVLASPTLLCFSMVGFPYLSAIIPYSFALALVFWARGVRTHSRLALLGEGIAWAALYQVGFFCYEVGRTATMVPAVAALTLRDLRPLRRVAYLVIAVLLGYGWFVLNPTQGTHRLRDLPAKLLAAGPAVTEYVHETIVTMRVDMPFLLLAALVAAVLVRRDGRFWRLLLLGQLGLIAINVANRDVAVARRYLLANFIAAVIVTWTWRDAARAGRAVLGGIVAAGMLFTFAAVVRFATRPLADVSLPYTYSSFDFGIEQDLIGDADAVASRVRQDSTPHVIVYGTEIYAETSLNPQAFPERVLVTLGPALFARQVTFFGRSICRYSCLPYRGFESFAETAEALGRFYLHLYAGPAWANDRTFTIRESTAVFDRFLNRARVEPVDLGLRRFRTFLVHDVRPPGPVAVPAVSIAALPTLNGDGRTLCGVGWKGEPDFFELFLARPTRGTSEELGAITLPAHLERPPYRALVLTGCIVPAANGSRATDLRTEIDGDAIVTANGQVVFDQLWAKAPGNARVTAFELAPGMNEIFMVIQPRTAESTVGFDLLLPAGARLSCCRPPGAPPP